MFQSLLILFSVSIAVKFHLEHSTTQTIYTCRILLIFLLIIPLLHYPFLYNIANKAEGGNLAASKIRNLECPNYEICLIDYGCGKFNRKIHIMEQYP